MPAIDPVMAKMIRVMDSEGHGETEMTFIADDEERRKAVSDFVKRRLQGAEKMKETAPQRRLRKSGLEQCLRAIRKREDDCYCPTTLILASTKAGKGLCTPCQRARDALQLWIQVEKLINRRLEIQRDYFTAICSAHKEVVHPPPPAQPVDLEPRDVVAAIEARRALDDENNASFAAKKTG